MRHQNILVIGGAGFIGRHVIHRLAALGRRVLVAARRRQDARDLILLPTVDVVDANVHDDATLARLIADQDAVINLVGILQDRRGPAGSPYGPGFARAHVELPRRIVKAAEQAHVRRLLHVSALGADPRAPSMYLRSKADGEAAVKAGQEDGIATTVFRPSVVFGREDRFLNMFAELAAWLPVLPLGSADACFQPVWVEDVAAAIVTALDTEATFGRTYELCGPRVYTLQELAEFAARASGHPRRVVALPAGLARLQARLMELLPGEPLLSRDNLDSMKVNNVASKQPYVPAPELGIHPASLEVEAAVYLSGVSAQRRFSRFRARAHR